MRRQCFRRLVRDGRRRQAGIVFAALMAVASCGDDDRAISATSGTSNSVAPPAAPGTNGSETEVPEQLSDFPDGVYRTRLTVSQLHDMKVDDLGNAGVWTVTVGAGKYLLECRTLADPGYDCGGSPAGGIVEAGTLHGQDSTVWFVHDMARLSRLTGCRRHSQASDGCGPEGGYHLDWLLVAHGIEFTHYIGLGDEAGHDIVNWTAHPWTRIS